MMAMRVGAELIEQFAIGEFGDERLKKLERNCMRDWSINRKSV